MFRVNWAPWVQGGPISLTFVVLVGAWWLLREIGLSNILVSGVAITQPESRLRIYASKTDQRALGASRAHRCACGKTRNRIAALEHQFCPACAVATQYVRLANRFPRAA